MKRIALVAVTGGCFTYSALPNDRPAPKIRTLADAKIVDMQINLHKQPGLCPGQEGKLYVNATVQWPGMKPVLRSLGNDVDSLDPASFVISGPLLTGDAEAHLHPDGDVLKSIEDGFVIDVKYKPEPRFAFHQMFPPEYSCFTGSYAPGATGDGGNGGQNGASGNDGDNGEPGGPGGDGGRGGDGGTIQAYVTIVATKFYPKLYAVIANDHFYLAPADRRLVFAAPGGTGGGGGQGGAGGSGGNQATTSAERSDGNGGTKTVTVGQGAAGNGANGGNGGTGGNGGNGGTVEVTYDSSFPELRQYLATDVSGGEGGAAGGAGPGGAGGDSNADENAQRGAGGGDGASGRAGRPGRTGRANVRAGSVAAMFRSIRGIQLAVGQEPARPATPRVPRRRR
jgi:hypothetical protein